MEFWIAALLMTGAVVALILLALFRRSRAQAGALSDLQVYKDQLAEVERDLARGVVSEREAEAVRVEVSRRLLEADRIAQAAARAGSAPRAANLALGAVLAVSVTGGAFWLYTRLGVPGYPDLPLAMRLEMAEEARLNRPGQAEAEAEMAALAGLPPEAAPEYLALVERLRAAVESRPDDLQGHLLLARNEAALGNYAAAREAQARAIELMGADAPPEALADYADIMVLAAGGYVSPEAESVLARVLRADPGNGTARYYSGLLALQTGRADVAFRLWDGLLRASAPDDPWVPAIRAQLPQLAGIAGERDYVLPEMGSVRGPTDEDIAAAAELTPEERMEMIRGMVDGLANRLATEGGPPEDWARLITALGALGNQTDALAVAMEAETVFADDDDALLIITRARQRVGL